MNIFISPTKIIIGNTQIEDYFHNYKRVFIVTDSFMHSSGKTKEILGYFSSDIKYEIFTDAKPDPDTDTVATGIEKILAFAPDVVVALGGGSAIDAAKAMIYFAKNKMGLKDVCFVAVPTTSGTGSEVTQFAVITDSSTGAKIPIVSPEMYPDVAILDPKLTLSVPPHVTADTGMDVLTHAIEAYVSKRANDFTDACALKAIELAYNKLAYVYKNPQSLEARESMHNASCLAGVAFSNAGLGLNHAMAHALGAVFKIPHGRANAILLPYVMSYNAGCGDKPTVALPRYAQIGTMLELGNGAKLPTALNLIRHILALINNINMPTKISDLEIAKDEFAASLDKMCGFALADTCLDDNPIEATEEDIRNIYINAFNGKLH